MEDVLLWNNCDAFGCCFYVFRNFLVLSAKLSCVLITISQNSKQNDIKMYKVISLMLSSSNHLYSIVVIIRGFTTTYAVSVYHH